MYPFFKSVEDNGRCADASGALAVTGAAGTAEDTETGDGETEIGAGEETDPPPLKYAGQGKVVKV